MYLSHLLINVGDNPDRPRPGREWLRNVYHVHQRLCMAFPARERKDRDPDFLQPFAEDDFPALRGDGRGPDGLRHRFLFRIDHSIDNRRTAEVILVQSQTEPDWEYAFHNAGVLLAAKPEARAYDPRYSEGDPLRFRLRVNLSKKSKEHRGAAKGYDAHGREKSQGKRIQVALGRGEAAEIAVREWFASKAARAGFDLDGDNFHVRDLGWVVGWRKSKSAIEAGHDTKPLRFRSALLEGRLRVTDAEAFGKAIADGIGAAKAFGFGLLSVLPERNPRD